MKVSVIRTSAHENYEKALEILEHNGYSIAKK